MQPPSLFVFQQSEASLKNYINIIIYVSRSGSMYTDATNEGKQPKQTKDETK